ncbi:MAG: hypothetical protein M3162_03235 [Thermoproteota archaeon]|nr:hypothetical protein [Thermoproteota archaeon]
MKLKFICEDTYEAEKFSSMFALQKDKSILVKEINKIIENEIILNLNDGTCHSISFKDKDNATMLKDLFPKIFLNREKIVSIGFVDNEVTIDLE